MLADAVESASRTLVDPTPGRIEGLVGDLAQRRLEAGQFDESGLTLRELGTIERSLAMSVASSLSWTPEVSRTTFRMKHSRPEQAQCSSGMRCPPTPLPELLPRLFRPTGHKKPSA